MACKRLRIELNGFKYFLSIFTCILGIGFKNAAYLKDVID